MIQAQMDPFTQKLLEKTRQRREQLQQKLQSTPTAATRKRKPLQVDTSQNVTNDRPALSDNENVEEKKRRSSTKLESSKSGSITNENSTTVPPKSRSGTFSDETEVDSGVGSENISRQHSAHTRGSSSDEPSPPPSTRRGRLQKLANQINNWEDDLSHPNIKPASPEPKQRQQQQRPISSADSTAASACSSQSLMTSSTVSNTNGNVRTEAANNKPPKPPRAFQADTPKVEELTSEPTARRSPRFTKQPSENKVNDAFAFGSRAGPSPSRGSPARPPQPKQTTVVKYSESRSSQSDDEPTKKAVADRFSMWEKKTGDALTPLRQGTPLRGARATPAKPSVFSGTPATQQSQTTEYKPSGQSETRQSRPARRRSRSATPNLQTPERERTGGAAAAPWQQQKAGSSSAVKRQAPPAPAANGAAPSTPRQQASASEDEWGKSQDNAFQKAPMSARKFAWEAKIAEQQNVASEHNRIMYRTRSATRLGDGGAGTPCQKQQAEDSLKQGQAKVYDPAERARQERQAELEALQNRFNNKGLLKSEQGAASKPAAQPQANAASLESLDDQQYYTASDSEMNAMEVHSSSNNATAGSSADERRTVQQQRRQVSFKSPTRERKQSASPPHSDHTQTQRGRSGTGSTGGESTASSASGHSTASDERRVKRRSSCKIPTLGYDSSSDEDDEVEINPISKLYPLRDVDTAGSPNKIPRLGDESSADSIDGMSRHTSCSSMGSSVSSDSYCFVSNYPDRMKQHQDGTPNSRAVVDFLDEAMSDDEAGPVIEEPPRRRSPRQHRATPPAAEVRQTRAATRGHQDKDSPAALYSIDQYRKKTKSVAQLPNSSSRRPVSVYDTDSYTDTDSSSQCSTVSEQDRRKRIKELQELVQQEQNVIVQASNALNQCCQSGSSFAGSTEQVECNRLLLIACQRRQAYLSEIERIKANPHTYEQRKGKGSLTISDIQLPLKRDFVKKIGSPEDDTVHYFLLMVRNGAQVIVTQMVSTHDALMRGVLHIPNLIKLNDIMNDFRYELEIYGMQVSREMNKPSGKKDKKKGTQSVTRNKSVSGRDAGSHSSSSSVRTTNFTHITSLMISMDCVRHTAFKLSRVPYLSPIQGTVHMTLRCTMEANVVFKGFINMFEDVGGFGAWHRRWCVLSNNRVSYWKYPDDERVKEPIGQLSLKDCVTTEVGLVSRDKCARPNTIELVIVRPLSKADNNTDSMNRQIRDRMVYEQHWFGMDTKSDRLEWCDKLNEALANVRQWYSDAARPIPAKRMEI